MKDLQAGRSFLRRKSGSGQDEASRFRYAIEVRTAKVEPTLTRW
jgi:hypothetical protein